MNGMSSYRRRLMAGAYPKGMPNYLCFTALEDGEFTFTFPSALSPADGFVSMSYSLDGVNWVTLENVAGNEVSFTTATILRGEKVYWRGNNTHTGNSYVDGRYASFSSTCEFDIEGDIRSLLAGKKIKSFVMSYVDFTFPGLFKGTNVVNANITLDENLIGKGSCFYSMFYNCVKLRTAPLLHGAINEKPSIYRNMFYGCSSLLTAPDLMSSVVSYEGYREMFRSATNLNYIKMLATDISATRALTNWMVGVQTNSGIFVKHIDAQWTTTGVSGVPANWTVIYYDPALDKYYLDQQRSQECDDHGNPI